GDNGCGMTQDDLKTAAHPHATSKIESETDLLNLTTLGFRGEALSSIAAVCRLSIISGGSIMRSSITEDHIIEPYSRTEGTIVMAEGLFENFPARRVFLKRPASEAALCKTTFIEKALPCPQKAFRFISDGDIKLDLPAGVSLTERFVQAMQFSESPSLFYEVTGQAAGEKSDWSFKIVIGEPGVYRKNKKDIHIYVNGRKITEYSLVQAIEYGGQGYFPNGTFPAAAAFIQVNPALVDFNIHPAKKEARFKDIADLHHGISSGLRSFFAAYTKKTMLGAIKASGAQYAFSNATRTRLDAIIAQGKTAEGRDETLFPTEKYEYPRTHSSYAENRGGQIFYSDDKIAGAPREHAGRTAEETAREVIELVDNAIRAYNAVDTDGNAAQVNTENRNIQSERSFQSRDGESQIALDEQTAGDGSEKVVIGEKRADFFTFGKSAYKTFGGAKTKPVNDEWKNAPFHFLGSALGTFIIAEKGNTLYIIDKHAAHERMLFDKIINEQGARQTLLIPYVLKTQDEGEDEYLQSIQEELSRIGFECSRTREGEWAFTAVQERWRGSEDELTRILLEKRAAPRDLIYTLAASAACKAAVKDGWILDDNAASEIAQAALCLPDPHCPHGRPVYTTLTREHLFSLVRRT
ncbi:MAG: DNA mismatch repair endonuclease MutL, partial [Treponema sp.]